MIYYENKDGEGKVVDFRVVSVFCFFEVGWVIIFWVLRQENFFNNFFSEKILRFLRASLRGRQDYVDY